ncbi:MAG TPA: FIST C-terminal domain-containing protein [Methylophilaceae bacterium]|nr:FIST C-terminal domain-containing protein [Methylophilaceae bacterium]
MRVATGLAMGSEADPALATQAVSAAMDKAGLTIAGSVLLFLTSDFARDPVPALRAAAKAANCTRVMGCSATGIFTEQEWVMDAPAAVAMVFGEGFSLQAPAHLHADTVVLTLAAPNAINTTWLSDPGQRFGGVSGDATGQGPFSVWENGKGAVAGHCEAVMQGVRSAVAAAHGLKLLTRPQYVGSSEGYDLVELGGQAALQALREACPFEEPLPLHRLMAVFGDDPEQIRQTRYQQAALVSGNEADSSVTLARPVQAGQYLSWALRETGTAQADLQQTAAQLEKQLAMKPHFGLLFSCLGRGPYFYGGVDMDLALLAKRYPGMPLIGFYGNGEIAPVNGQSQLLQYSAVLGLFAADA